MSPSELLAMHGLYAERSGAGKRRIPEEPVGAAAVMTESAQMILAPDHTMGMSISSPNPSPNPLPPDVGAPDAASARRPEMVWPRHIALVITALGPGGAERVMTAMANHWTAAGHRVSFVTYESPTAESYYDLDPHVAVERLHLAGEQRSALGGLWRTGRRVLALRRCLKRLRPDVAIAFLTRVNIATLLAAKGLPLPVIVSERNHPDRQHLNRTWRWLRDVTYGRAATLVCQTEAAKSFYPPALQARAVVIANPLRPIQPAINPAAKHELVAVGRLNRQKGFDLLIRAFARIAADRPSWRLTIWGEGDERALLQALVRDLGLEERIRLPGVTREHGAWVEGAGLFVLSSRYEGLPNVLLEAMAAGLPVVAFDCPHGPAEIITAGENGLLVPPEDVEALAASLAKLMADENERRRLARNAQAIAQTYQLEAIMAAWSGLLETARPVARNSPSR
jgi:glycosyltransferase involved in cell wall biosynthesis